MKILLLCLVSLTSNSIFAQRVIEENGPLEIISDHEKAMANAEYESIEWNGSFGMTLKDGKQGMINRTGKIVIPNEYESIEWNGNLGKTIRGGKMGLINLDGKVIIPNEYESIEWNGSIGRTLKNGEIGYLNLNGKRPSNSVLKTLRLEDLTGASPASKPTRREE